MSEFFLMILNMSISASWLVLAVLILRLLLKKAPKWVSVVLWGIVGIRLICPFSIESALSLIPSTQTVSPEIMTDWTPEISTGIAPLDSIVNPIISASFAPDPAASANPLQILIPVGANIWVLVGAMMLIYLLVSYWHLRRKVATAIRYNGQIYQSENVSAPFVLGVVKPRIYIPFGMRLQDLGYVVAHEQAHIRRKDHLWKLLGFLLLTVHWFNPLMWVGYILLSRDIELSCDESVIKTLDDDQRADYTQALVSCSIRRHLVTACPLAFGEVGVKERVRSVMNYKKPAFWSVVLALIVCVCAAVCFLTDPLDSNGYLELFKPVDFEKKDIAAYISAGTNLTDGMTLNGDVLILDNDGGFWELNKGQQINVSIAFENDGSYMSMKAVGCIFCDEKGQWKSTDKIFADQSVGVSNGSFTVKKDGKYLFYFRNFSSSWLDLKSFSVKIMQDAFGPVTYYDLTPREQIADVIDNEDIVVIKQHYESVDGRWTCEGNTYQYRLQISGKMHSAAKNTTFIVLSNTGDLTFEQTWRAAGFGSNLEDYFDPADAVVVGYKMFS